VTADKNFKRLVRARARRTGESYSSARRELLAKRPATQEELMHTIDPGSPDRLVEVTVVGVPTNARGEPNLVLTDGTRRLPIFIGPDEARAIAYALQQVEPPRPLTHDALKQTVDALHARLVRIVVAFEPNGRTFDADVVLAMADGSEQHLDWRVSDSVALAVRYDPRPPIFVAESLLAKPPHPVGAQVRCACGEWILLDEDVLSDRVGPFSVDVECLSCGLKRQVQIVSPRPPTVPEGPGRPT